MSKAPPKRKRPVTPTAASDCVIPPAIPVEALSGLLFEQDEKSAEQIVAYVEQQSRGEIVTHPEKVMSQRVLGRTYECWDDTRHKSDVK